MTNLNKNIIAIQNNYLCLPVVENNIAQNNLKELATIVSNFNYYGFMPSYEVFKKLQSFDVKTLTSFWKDIEISLKKITGEDKNISDFVVYKNFPKESLSKTRSEYVIDQILIYFGVSYDSIREKELVREEMKDKITYKVLQEAPIDIFSVIFNSLCQRANAWTDIQKETAEFLFQEMNMSLDMSEFNFKENGATLSKLAIGKDLSIKADIATDILRIAYSWSEVDFSTPAKSVVFKKFKRSERRFLLSLLENSKTLENDVRMKKDVWKKLFGRLNPNDYKFKKVNTVYNLIYNKKIKGMESSFKKLLSDSNDLAISEAVKMSPGFYVRNIHQLYKAFGKKTFEVLPSIVQKLSVSQLIKLSKYIETENNKRTRLVAPKGNWRKIQLIENKKVRFLESDILFVTEIISNELNRKLKNVFPNGVFLSKELDSVKLPTNDLKLDLYGRGTSFEIPENIKTIRLASYWENGERVNGWFDNGVNLLSENLEDKGCCTWDTGNTKGAIFSGDPLPSNDMKGRGAQLIDLDLEKLKNNGSRYVLWSILSYNNKPFSQVPSVFGAMQFCEDSELGNLFEPSRCQMMFDIADNSLSKYVAYIDTYERKIVFLDANLPASTNTARYNTQHVIGEEGQFSALLQYIDSQPSVFDLLKTLKSSIIIKESELNSEMELPSNIPYFGFSDENIIFKDENQKSYLFKHTRETNKFERINVLDLLSII